MTCSVQFNNLFNPQIIRRQNSDRNRCGVRRAAAFPNAWKQNNMWREWGRFTMFSLRSVLRRSRRCRCSSARQRRRCGGLSCTQLMSCLPFNRMQLWIFPSQRDNKVSSGAENEAVVCSGRGHEACGCELNQFFVGGVCVWRGCISRDTSKLTIDRTLERRGELLGNTFFMCQKNLFSPETHLQPDSMRGLREGHYCRLLKVSYHVSPIIWNPKPSSLSTQRKRTRWQLTVQTFVPLVFLHIHPHKSTFVVLYEI